MIKHARLFLACMLWLSMATMATAQTELSGSEVGNGTFYLKNVGTGLYLKFGGAGNAKAAEGHAGTAITLEKSGNGYTIKTNVGYLDGNLKMTGTATEWTFEEVDAANNYYQIKNNDNLKYLASKSDAYGLLGLEAGNTANNKEKWMLVEKADLFSLFDMTPLIQAASFDTNDNVTVAWNISSGDISIAYEGTDAEEHYLEVTEATTITQNLGKAQVGNYVLSFEAHYTGEGDAPKVRLQLGNKNKDHAEITISKNDNWESYTGSIGVNGNVKGDIVITITTNTNTTLYLDNFELVYKEGKKQQIGDAEEEAQHKYDERALEEISLIRAYIEEYYPNGLTFFNDKISTMEENLKGEEVTISTESEYKNYLAQINQIKEDAKQEHRELSKENNDNNNIFNPGFEIGNLNAWITNGDIIKREEFTAGTAPGTGSYIFLGSIIGQEIYNLPTGKYTLTAKVASTNGANVTLTATHGSQTWESNLQQTTGETTEIKIENIIIYNGSLLIQVSGDKEFYADDFTLSFKELILHESSTKMFKPTENEYASITMTRNMKAGVWNTFVVPFDMAIPTGWEVKTLTGSTLNNENISLTFSDASSIEAGKPYMVRVSEAVTEITLENVNLSTTLNNTTTDHVEFTGVYTNGNVPQGAFFISSNTFYRAADNSNTMKAFRAYIKIKDSVPQSARSLSYRTDGETTAIDNSQLANDNEATVVAIYNLQGVRLDDMQVGVNILQMSDGRVVKVIIK